MNTQHDKIYEYKNLIYLFPLPPHVTQLSLYKSNFNDIFIHEVLSKVVPISYTM